jgi:SET domain-containing protein
MPSHWPQNVRYITTSEYHSSVPRHVRIYIQGHSQSSQPQRERPSVTIRRLTTLTHPACGQFGLFASKKIPPRTRILDYLGEVHCDERDSDYDLSLYRSEDGYNVGVDAALHGNEARFINDFRGVRDKPNAFFVDVRTTSGELRMSVWSGSEMIKKGDEILVSYGKPWWNARKRLGS